MAKHRITVTSDELGTIVRAMDLEVDSVSKEIVGREERGDDPDFMQAFYNVRNKYLILRERLAGILKKKSTH